MEAEREGRNQPCADVLSEPVILAAREYILAREIAWNEEYADNVGKCLLPDQRVMFHRLIDAQPGERILDAGCGPGFFTEMCLQAGA